ncbi:uncharacterized protein BO97DRAFT_446773 [Aspergillus homomorphus CBS 101889]|uniref:Uncharacterized protein n=1 Tax=Aspergillus homomorphus (strain CBS 101889) TaxID=1450537 RepID=A0A395HIX3_ASPHC|nr:hypothetical protein BO97DRAFT_446773 [Aspergillus homomorphus CBS 101889]RAL07586.1 hypothetical protein BO97DRAFT_446773 [Aspergillus homomorphus CBS 101889]
MKFSLALLATAALTATGALALPHGNTGMATMEDSPDSATQTSSQESSSSPSSKPSSSSSNTSSSPSPSKAPASQTETDTDFVRRSFPSLPSLTVINFPPGFNRGDLIEP